MSISGSLAGALACALSPACWLVVSCSVVSVAPSWAGACPCGSSSPKTARRSRSSPSSSSGTCGRSLDDCPCACACISICLSSPATPRRGSSPKRLRAVGHRGFGHRKTAPGRNPTPFHSTAGGLPTGSGATPGGPTAGPAVNGGLTPPTPPASISRNAARGPPIGSAGNAAVSGSYVVHIAPRSTNTSDRLHCPSWFQRQSDAPQATNTPGMPSPPLRCARGNGRETRPLLLTRHQRRLQRLLLPHALNDLVPSGEV